MGTDGILEGCIRQSPVTVMARLVLQQAISPEWMNAVFERHRRTQYMGELLFSTTVDVMSLVVLGQRPSLHAAAKAAVDLPVSLVSLYAKTNGIEPQVIAALVAGSAQRLTPVLEPMLERQTPLVPGYQVRIIDGNHLPASEKRLKPLRQFRGAALPGQSLVVYDPDRDMVVDLVPCEDAHAQERALMGPILASAQPGQLWMADRNFCTRRILLGWHHARSTFVVREHACSPNAVPVSRLRKIGRIDTGVVYEQQVGIEDEAGETVLFRRIELRLDQPTEDGDTVIGLLTNLPQQQSLPAMEVAQLYRRRWKIETLFQRLESVFHSEIDSLGQPCAALFAFGVAALAYNVLSVVHTAIRIRHELAAAQLEISTYYLAMEMRTYYAGMMMAVPAACWQIYEGLTPRQLGNTLMQIAAHADPRRLRKHTRAPKAPKKKTYVSKKIVQQHVSTARVMAKGHV
jgi:IS4 transposase